MGLASIATRYGSVDLDDLGYLIIATQTPAVDVMRQGLASLTKIVGAAEIGVMPPSYLCNHTAPKTCHLFAFAQRQGNRSKTLNCAV